MSNADLEYFMRGQTENPRFFARLGGEPSFRGLSVLDFGCGHGSLCIYIAERGARRVIGVDIAEQLIEFASQNLAQHYPQFNRICEFHCIDISRLTSESFDVVVSKNTFEHVIKLEDYLAHIMRLLKPGGRLYVGFGPLYKSPFGPHDRFGPRLRWVPWWHLILPEEMLIR